MKLMTISIHTLAVWHIIPSTSATDNKKTGNFLRKLETITSEERASCAELPTDDEARGLCMEYFENDCTTERNEWCEKVELDLLLALGLETLPWEDPCDPIPCQNGGACDGDNDSENGYVCLCAEGWTGTDCDRSCVESEEALRNAAITKEPTSIELCPKSNITVQQVIALPSTHDVKVLCPTKDCIIMSGSTVFQSRGEEGDLHIQGITFTPFTPVRNAMIEMYSNGDLLVDDCVFGARHVREAIKFNPPVETSRLILRRTRVEEGEYAVTASGGIVIIEDSVFQALLGHALVFNFCDEVRIDNSTFHKNGLGWNWSGGAIEIYSNGGITTITNSIFTENFGYYAGAIYLVDNGISQNYDFFSETENTYCNNDVVLRGACKEIATYDSTSNHAVHKYKCMECVACTKC